MSFNIGEIFFDLNVGNISEITNSIKGAVSNIDTSSITAFAKKNEQAFQSMAVAGGIAFTAISAGILGAVKSATNLGESINAVNVIFGKSSNVIKDFGKTASKTVGLSNQEFSQLSATLGSALQNVGLSAEQSAQQTIELTKRASDMASIFNTDVKTALEAIQSGLRGEADPLEKFGVGLSDSAVKAYALSNGIIASNREMSTQEKATARIGLLMEQTNKIAGDFARTAGEGANQTRVLNATLTDATAQLGQAFKPIIEQVTALIVPMIQGISEWITNNQELAKYIGITALAVTGFITVVGTLGLLLPTIVTGLGYVKVALVAMTGPVGIAITAIVGLYTAWSTNFLGIRDIVASVRTGIKTAFINGVEFIKNNINLLIGLLPGIGPGLLLFKKAFDTNFAGIRDIVNTVVEAVTRAINAIKNLLGISSNIPSKLNHGIVFLYIPLQQGQSTL